MSRHGSPHMKLGSKQACTVGRGLHGAILSKGDPSRQSTQLRFLWAFLEKARLQEGPTGSSPWVWCWPFLQLHPHPTPTHGTPRLSLFICFPFPLSGVT